MFRTCLVFSAALVLVLKRLSGSLRSAGRTTIVAVLLSREVELISRDLLCPALTLTFGMQLCFQKYGQMTPICFI